MHQCLKCKTYYEDESVPIIGGCSCGSRIFLFVKHRDDAKRADKVYAQIEDKIRELELQRTESKKSAGQQELTTPPGKYEAPKDRYSPAAKAKKEQKKFGVETIKVRDIGVYEINIDALLKGSPIIVLSKGGSYIISLPSIFGKDAGEVVLKE